MTDAPILADVLQVLRDIRDTLRDQSRQPAELLSRDDMPTLLSVGMSTFDRLRAELAAVRAECGTVQVECGTVQVEVNE